MKTISDTGRIFSLFILVLGLIFLGTSLFYVLCWWFSLKITGTKIFEVLEKNTFLLPILMPESPTCLKFTNSCLENPWTTQVNLNGIHARKGSEVTIFPELLFSPLLINTTAVFLVISWGWGMIILFCFLLNLYLNFVAI